MYYFSLLYKNASVNTIVSGSSVPDSVNTTMEHTIYACNLFSLQSIEYSSLFLELKDLYSVFYLVFLML